MNKFKIRYSLKDFIIRSRLNKYKIQIKNYKNIKMFKCKYNKQKKMKRKFMNQKKKKKEYTIEK